MTKKYDMTKIESIYEYALQMQNQKISDIVKEAGKKECVDKGEIGILYKNVISEYRETHQLNRIFRRLRWN